MRRFYIYIFLISGCATTHVTVSTPNPRNDALSQDDLHLLNKSPSAFALDDKLKSETASEMFWKSNQSDTQYLYDKMLDRTNDYHCHFTHTMPKLLFDIEKESKRVSDFIIKDNVIYMLGYTIVMYNPIDMTPKFKADIPSGLLINDFVVRKERSNETNSSSLVAYEILSGEILWKINFATQNSSYYYYANHIYILSPITTTISRRDPPLNPPPARLYKYTINGELVWDVDLETIQKTPHSMLRLFAAYDNKLFLTDDHAFLIAYDATDGHEIWCINRSIQGSGGIDENNRRISDLLYTYNIDTGALIWRKKMIKHAPCVHIRAISDGIVFTNESCDGPYIAAYDNLSGELLWSAGANDGSDVDSNIFVAGDLLISGLESKPDIIARNKYTGEIVWQFTYRENGKLPNGRVFCQDDWLFVVDDDRIYVYGYRDSSQDLSTNSTCGGPSRQ